MVTISYNVHCCKECHFFSDRESPLESVPIFYCDKNMEEMIEQDNEGYKYYPDIEKNIWSKCPFGKLKSFHIVNEINKVIENLSILNQKIYDNQK